MKTVPLHQLSLSNSRTHERFEPLPSRSTLRTSWLAYAQDRYIINTPARHPVIYTKTPSKKWDSLQHQIDVAATIRNRQASLAFIESYERAYT
jgi:hypothetical protein